MKLYLTEKFIRDYLIPAGLRQQLLFDLGLSRFAVSITSRGAKSYVIVYRDMEGRQRQEKLADAGTVTLRAARSFALARLQELDVHRTSKGRCGPCPTMDSFFCQIFFPIVKAQSRSYATHAGLYRNHIQNAFGARRLDDISEDDVLAFHAALTTKPVSGKNVGIRTLSEGTVKRIMILLRHILNESTPVF